MAVYDCFTFFNELDILYARLKELENVVDYHVVVESTKTFSNRGKSLFFEENKGIYEMFLDKIIHVIVDDMPMDENAWVNETFQRNAIARGLVNADPNDLVLIGDVDEIPDSTLASHWQRQRSMRQQFFYYNPYTEIDCYWHGTLICTVDDINIVTPQVIRDQRYTWTPLPVDGWHGWHLSYWGGIERIQSKIESMSDVHLNTPAYTNSEHLEAVIKQGKDLFDRDFNFVQHNQSPIPTRVLLNL